MTDVYLCMDGYHIHTATLLLCVYSTANTADSVSVKKNYNFCVFVSIT